MAAGLLLGQIGDVQTINGELPDETGNIELNASSIGAISNDPLSVKEVNLALDSVSSSKIQKNAVTTDKINNETVTEEKVKDGAITTAKIGNNAVDASKIANEAVSSIYTFNVSYDQNWSKNGDAYQADITVPGILSADHPIVDIKLMDKGSVAAQELLEEYSKIYSVIGLDNIIRLKATDKINSTITLQAICVRK